MKKLLKYILPTIVVGLIATGIVGAAVITPYFGGGTGTSTPPAKGSLLFGYSTTQYGVLPVGTNNLCLVASSTSALGAVWSSCSAGSGGGSNWLFSSATALSPTTTVGIIINASSTFSSTLNGNLTGNASTATNLASNPTNCAAGQYPLGIDASGNVESCTVAGGSFTTTTNDYWFNNTAGVTGNSNLVTVGTIGTGVWQGTSVKVGYGGTGLTAATAGYTLIGSTATALQATSSLFINSTGYVGIGTTSPVSLLSIYSTTASPVLTITNGSATNTYDPQIDFRTGSTPATRQVIYIDDSDSDKLKIATSSTGSLPALTIGTNGYIGVQHPDNSATAMEIKETGTNYLTFDTTDSLEKMIAGKNFEIGTMEVDADSGAVQFANMNISTSTVTSTVESLSISLDGTSVLTVYGESSGYLGTLQNQRVGIGTTTPAVSLDIYNGLMRATQTSTSTCSATIGGAIFYQSTDKHFYGCDGTTWLKLDN